MAAINVRAVTIVTVVVFLLYYLNYQRSHAVPPDKIRSALAEQHLSLRVLNESGYGDFQPDGRAWLNLTGFSRNEGYAWNLLPKVQELAKQQLQRVSGATALEVLNGTSNQTLQQYQNATGWLTGRWVRSSIWDETLIPPHINLSLIMPNITYSTLKYSRNITGLEGKLRFELEDVDDRTNREDTYEATPVTRTRATLTLQDETSSGFGWEIPLSGIHHRDYGGILLTTTSEKYAGIFGLPHFSLSIHAYGKAQSVLSRSLAEDVQLQETDLEEALTPWTQKTLQRAEGSLTPRCELIVYLQQHRVRSVEEVNTARLDNHDSLAELEQELRFPTGDGITIAPKLASSMVAFSPDCGFVIESKGPPRFSAEEGLHLQGFKIEAWTNIAKRWSLLLVVVLSMQLGLLAIQMKDACTPSKKSRISFYTVALLCFGNSITWLAFLTESFFLDSLFLLSTMIAFLGILEGGMFGMKFLLDIWSVQNEERADYSTTVARAPSTVPNNTVVLPTTVVPQDTQATQLHIRSASSTDLLTLPIALPHPAVADTTNNPSAPEIVDGMTATPRPNSSSLRTFGSIYVRFYLLLLFVTFLSLNAATSWPPLARSIFANTFAFVYLSFWVPQIYRNLVRNCRKALQWSYVIGQSVCRLIPIAYFWGVQDNVLFVDADPYMLLLFSVWLWLQILVLLGQQFVGPRFFISESWSWIPPAWDYHTLIYINLEDGAMPIGLHLDTGDANDSKNNVSLTSNQNEMGRADKSASENTTQSQIKRSFDCAICMQIVEVPIVSSNQNSQNTRSLATGLAGLFERQDYMVTPCRHIFHTSCLNSWLAYRLQCPVCRESLPPL